MTLGNPHPMTKHVTHHVTKHVTYHMTYKPSSKHVTYQHVTMGI